MKPYEWDKPAIPLAANRILSNSLLISLPHITDLAELRAFLVFFVLRGMYSVLVRDVKSVKLRLGLKDMSHLLKTRVRKGYTVAIKYLHVLKRFFLFWF